jgi:hypothetical protein
MGIGMLYCQWVNVKVSAARDSGAERMLPVKEIINLVAEARTTASVAGKGRGVGSLGRWYGPRAQARFQENHIDVIVGVMESNPEKAVLNYLSGSLTKRGNV